MCVFSVGFESVCMCVCGVCFRVCECVYICVVGFIFVWYTGVCACVQCVFSVCTVCVCVQCELYVCICVRLLP